MSKYVLKLLESYNERERKIAVLRYNLEHPAKVSRSEQIEAMNFGHGDGLDHSAGHISNKTLYIALNYEEQAERMNAESAHEIAKELFALECEQRRLTYFIGLLDKRQAEVIRLVFVDGIPTKEVAASFGLTYRTIDRIKRTAIENLAEMYAKWENFYKVIKRAMIACENSGRSTLECFPEVRKTSPMPNGGVKDILDYELSRYACYLIVQNGDPRKEVIALGQTYFAIELSIVPLLI